MSLNEGYLTMFQLHLTQVGSSGEAAIAFWKSVVDGLEERCKIGVDQALFIHLTWRVNQFEVL